MPQCCTRACAGNISFIIGWDRSNFSQRLAITVFFSFLAPSFEIEGCLACQCDYLSIIRDSFSALSVLGDDCGRKSTIYQKYLLKTQGKMPSVEPNGRDIYIRFVSDDSVHYRGFNFSFIVESDRGK